MGLAEDVEEMVRLELARERPAPEENGIAAALRMLADCVARGELHSFNLSWAKGTDRLVVKAGLPLRTPPFITITFSEAEGLQPLGLDVDLADTTK